MDADAVPSIPSSSSVAAMPPSCHVVRQRPSSANRSASVTAAAFSNVATTTAPETAPSPRPPPAIKVPRVRSIRDISFNVDAVHFRINVSIFFCIFFLYFYVFVSYFIFILLFFILIFARLYFIFIIVIFLHHEFRDFAIKCIRKKILRNSF